MPQIQEKRIARHLTLLAEGVEHLGEHPPRSSEELEMQRLFADTAVEVALAIVCELLPSELQPTARRLIALRDAIWHREIQPEGGKEL